jgi:hypothetical protein
MRRPKRIDARYKWELEKQIWKRHPDWNLGQVLAQVAIEVAKLKNRRSFHVHGMDPFTIKAIRFIGAIRGETVAEVIASAIDNEVGEYPDLCRSRDEHLAQFGDAEQRDRAEIDVRMER